ncbi:MAG: hypothetical protein MJ252_16145 [archaeon]|nr:hypothetical protein [archaeon]
MQQKSKYKDGIYLKAVNKILVFGKRAQQIHIYSLNEDGTINEEEEPKVINKPNDLNFREIIEYYDSYFITINSDHTIRKWNSNTLQCEMICKNGNLKIYEVIIFEDKSVIYSDKEGVKKKLEEWNESRILPLGLRYDEPPQIVKINENTVFTEDYYDANLWKINNDYPPDLIKCYNVGVIYPYLFYEEGINKLIGFENDKTIRIADFSSNNLPFTDIIINDEDDEKPFIVDGFYFLKNKKLIAFDKSHNYIVVKDYESSKEKRIIIDEVGVDEFGHRETKIYTNCATCLGEDKFILAVRNVLKVFQY